MTRSFPALCLLLAACGPNAELIRYTVDVDAAYLELEALRRGFGSLELDAAEFEAVAGETKRLVLRPR